jgi:hypothetical protein
METWSTQNLVWHQNVQVSNAGNKKHDIPHRKNGTYCKLNFMLVLIIVKTGYEINAKP